MINSSEKQPVVPRFVDMGNSILLAVPGGNGDVQRFIKDDAGRIVAPTGVFGLAYFSIEEIALKIRFLRQSDDPWLNKTAEYLQYALDNRLHLANLLSMDVELVFCIIYRNEGDKVPPCGFTLIPVLSSDHLASLEEDAVSHGDSYYCFVRRLNDADSFWGNDIRMFMIYNEQMGYLRRLKDGKALWTHRRNKAARFPKLRSKRLHRCLRTMYPNFSFRIMQFQTKTINDYDKRRK